MSTWAARYARLGDRTRDLQRLRGRATAGASVRDDGISAFGVWLGGAPDAPTDDLARLSRDFGEVLAIGIHSVADLFVYDHFEGGDRVRGLTYAGEAGWVRVAGEPEAWEAAALFAPGRLEQLLQALAEDFTDDALERERSELQRIWQLGRLVEGSTRPPADGPALVSAIERHFRLPARPPTA